MTAPDCPNCAAMREILQAFKEQEFAAKADWQGLCPFRRVLGCQATDGHVSALGTPKPKPHSKHCPYARIAALEGEGT